MGNELNLRVEVVDTVDYVVHGLGEERGGVLDSYVGFLCLYLDVREYAVNVLFYALDFWAAHVGT